MNKSTAILIAVVIILGVGLAYSSIITFFVTIEVSEGARPRDGISVTHSSHIDINSMVFYVITTRDPNLIEVRFYTNPNVNTLKPGIVGIYFPYKVELDKEYNTKYTDFTNWYKDDSYKHGTAFVRNFTCNDKNECNLYQDVQVRFILNPEVKFDSKNIYRHSIKMKFDDTVGEARDFFEKFEDSRNLEYRIHENSTRQATIIIPENAERIHTIPLPDPDIFHNSGADYSNLQLDWRLTKDTHVFFVDFEISDERINFEKRQYDISATSIIVGVPLALLAIVIPIIYSRTGKEEQHG